ncbi:phage/plasmid primase, P4 family [Paenibacillus sp. HB172176]|uniref:DNA primase family protein n=1 Tax=Paenibacillus sp. HB172176 TaxID=2493690 RepID=UPI00143999DD|nr:phage/plasmid primase, P4 family [Paenibacillus sp. HB172176]
MNKKRRDIGIYNKISHRQRRKQLTKQTKEFILDHPVSDESTFLNDIKTFEILQNVRDKRKDNNRSSIEKIQTGQKSQVENSQDTGDDVQRNLAYRVLKYFQDQHQIICVEGRFFLYVDRLGCFEEMDERQLAIRIRASIPQNMDRRLDKMKMKDLMYRLETDPEIQIEHQALDNFSNLINLKNGVFDIQNGELKRHSPKYLMTSYIDANYYPDNPLWDKFEGSCFSRFLYQCTGGNINKIASLQELTGYLLSNEYRAKKFFVLIGPPHTGKSVWLTLWKSFIGSKHTTGISLAQLCKNRFMLAELSRSKLNLSAEMNENGNLKGIEQIKIITGNDLLTGERKGRDPFQFYARTKLVAAGNHMPLPEGLDSSDAFIDRILFLVFEDQVPEKQRNKHLIEELLNEMDLILYWALEGLRRLQDNKFIFTESDAAMAFKQTYYEEKNTVSSFVQDMCVITSGECEDREHRKVLINAYREYCLLNGLRIVNDTSFANELKHRGFKQKKFRKGGTDPLLGFLGVRLKTKDELLEEHPELVSVYRPRN